VHDSVGGTILLYNGQTARLLRVRHWGSRGRADAEKFTPKVVVIVI